ncbi:MAG TPA: sigma-70 family RNA polymerase sigma factor [Chthoniobacterales bacterium]
MSDASTAKPAGHAPAAQWLSPETAGRENFRPLDKMPTWRRLIHKDRNEVMENVAAHEDWRVCFTEAAPGLVLFARQFVRSAADAEDIVQDAFVKFWRKQHPIENRALLFATVRSTALDLLRRDARRARREADLVAESEHSVAPQFETTSESQQSLAAAIDRLPAEQREVLVMKIWNELTFAEIATILGISQNTAASRYRYALAALKKNVVSQ